MLTRAVFAFLLCLNQVIRFCGLMQSQFNPNLYRCCWTKHTTSLTTTNTETLTHHHRWHQMLLRRRTGGVCCWSPCTATDSAGFDCIGSTKVSRCCGWEEEETGRTSWPWPRTAAWSTPWRPCFHSSSYHTPYPSFHYGGSPLYQSSGPDLRSVWLLSSLHRDTEIYELWKLI